MNKQISNMRFDNRIGFSKMSFAQKQTGTSLVVTMIVLLVLTLIAISATNSNQSQSIMVRNNQFRLEAFNTSYAEIDGQVDFINMRDLSDGVPVYLQVLIDGNFGDQVSDSQTGDSNLAFRGLGTDTGYMDREVIQRNRGTCIIYGQQVGAGNENVKCNQLEIESESDVVNTNVGSTQFQVYEYRTLN